ncbi:MAG: LysM peptidoglycan-binding domain-containing protein [Phycisphaerales bacterium]
MTSDAKIGLLLGLIFIFVVAFIINGLPNLKPQASRAEVATNMVPLPDQSIDIGGPAKVQADQEWRGLADPQEAQVETEELAGAQPAVVEELPAQETETANSPEIRFESPLPRIENLLERITLGLQNQREQTSTVNMDVPTPATMEPAVAAERQPIVHTIKPQETASPSGEQTRPAATTPARQPERTYVVGEGESLSTVAKKVYGLEEGNRIVNVNRIYEANKAVLRSVDDVIAGQKLVIPPLPKTATVNPNKPSDVLPKDLFERVEALKRPAAQAPATSVETRWYTVQDGDNLWRIASSQLGAGARYDEIAKLNADLLKDPSKVGPGTKIRLPLK